MLFRSDTATTEIYTQFDTLSLHDAPPINPTLRPDVDDISAVVDKFKDVSGAVSKARAQLYTNVPNPSASVDFSDIAACVDAYKGQSYPFPGPSNCP